MAAGPLHAGVEESEPAPARVEPAPDLELALRELPPGIRAAAPEAPAPLAVEYTVDAALEAQIREILARSGLDLAQVIVMDPATGEVFAYVATDPQAFPATRAYPTASLMKVVTAAAVLRKAPSAARRSCRYRGSPYELDAAQLEAPRSGGRLESFEDALAISNNQCFARLAVHDVGRAALLEEIERVGLLAPPAAGHPGGASSRSTARSSWGASARGSRARSSRRWLPLGSPRRWRAASWSSRTGSRACATPRASSSRCRRSRRPGASGSRTSPTRCAARCAASPSAAPRAAPSGTNAASRCSATSRSPARPEH